MNKFYKIEAQILHQIKKLNVKLTELNTNRKDYSDEVYWALFNRYHGGIDYLTMTLTCFDNPLSNYEFDNLTPEQKKKLKNGK